MEKANFKLNSKNTSSSLFRLLIVVMIFSFMSANELDSLHGIIKDYEGLPRIKAKLQIGYLHRHKDYSIASKYLKEAYNEAVELELIDMQATAMYYLGLASHYLDHADSALIYLNKSAEYYQQENDIKYLGKALTMYGTVYLRVTGDQAETMAKYNEALVYSRKTSDHSNMAIIYSQISNIFRLDGAYQQAIEFIIKSKEQYAIAGNDEGVAWITYSIGRIYSTMNQFKGASEAFSEALECYSALPESNKTLIGEAISHDELGMSLLKLGDLETARFHNQQALDIYVKLDLQFGLSNAYKYRALIESRAGVNELALEYLNKANVIKKTIQDVLGYPGVYKLYGEILYDEGHYEAAVDSLYIGLRHAKNNGQKSITINICSLLADIYFSEGDHQKACEYRSNQVALSDSISMSKASKTLSQIEILYDFEKQQNKIRELEQENIVNQVNLEREITVRNMLLIILSMAIVFAFFMLKLFASHRNTNKTLKGNQSKLQELNATKDKFNSIIAHDLKSPFNTLLGFSTLLKKALERKDYDKVSEYSGHIEKVSEQSYKLLENLLEWSRSQTGKISFEPRAMDIRVPIQKTIELMEPIATQKEIKIDVNIMPVVVLADENMLQAILQNLISNAIKYSHHKGQIKVNAIETDDALELSIRDFGVGMDEDRRSKLFMLDESISEPGTDGEQRTGVGLILCEEFAERHRGRIDVESVLDKGACFTLFLPL